MRSNLVWLVGLVAALATACGSGAGQSKGSTTQQKDSTNDPSACAQEDFGTCMKTEKDCTRQGGQVIDSACDGTHNFGGVCCQLGGGNGSNCEVEEGGQCVNTPADCANMGGDISGNDCIGSTTGGTVCCDLPPPPPPKTCEQAFGTCVPLVPDACEHGTVGDPSQYSCGGGVGVECCLPLAGP